jgi:hypothetical protein
MKQNLSILPTKRKFSPQAIMCNTKEQGKTKTHAAGDNMKQC